ncbi:hypothetical protein Hypma_003569 [Hypsizygus marmoreus]|uniref:F-box domain-containing protein n=1 Tax=Hypsizygus marmoreus TaxID=39966 RepID=A0A369J1P0_HYPMA|nr:hypothetical protein Hypma_003569 [Hypsizygus marmoreus]
MVTNSTTIQHKPSFLQLPGEILEDILSELDLPRDLISLALVCRAAKNLVIPRHSEYRVIRTHSTAPFLWAHLARRADLARHIREVQLCARIDFMVSDRCPVTLIDRAVDCKLENVEELARIQNMCQALRHMVRLQVFKWANGPDGKGDRPNSACEDLVLRVVSQKASLRHLELAGICGKHVRNGKGSFGYNYPVWDISGLLSLSLPGSAWFEASNVPHVLRMLERSPNLEFLQLPMEFPRLSECRFPRLKRVKLPLVTGVVASSSVDMLRVVFLENHPAIEELSWFPIGPVQLSAGSLPSLKRLMSGRQVIEALEETATLRFIECLDVWGLDSQSLISLKNVHGPSLLKLKLHSVGSLESLYTLAETFPSIVWLSLPSVYLSHQPTAIEIDDWFNILPRFAKLEVFRGTGIWAACDDSKPAMHRAIMHLVQLCPNLRQLDHCDIDQKRHDFNRIKIIREGMEGENVRYEVHRPPQWHLFDAMDGTFD